MSGNTAAILVAVIAAVVSVLTAVLTYRSAGRANSATEKKVDLEEHRDAIARLRQIIDEQDRQIDRIRAQMERVQEQLAREIDVSAALRQQIHTLQSQVDELTRSRARLEALLAVTKTNRPTDVKED